MRVPAIGPRRGEEIQGRAARMPTSIGPAFRKRIATVGRARALSCCPKLSVTCVASSRPKTG